MATLRQHGPVRAGINAGADYAITKSTKLGRYQLSEVEKLTGLNASVAQIKQSILLLTVKIMYITEHDFEGFGTKNELTESMELYALALGLADTDIRFVANRYMIVELDGYKTRIDLGSSVDRVKAQISFIAPKLVTSDESLDQDVVSEITIELHQIKDRQLIEFDEDNEIIVRKMTNSTLLHSGLISSTTPFQNILH